MKKRKDGRYCRQMRVDGKVISFYGRTQAEVNKKVLAYNQRKETGRLFKDVAADWKREYLKDVPLTTFKKCGHSAYISAIDAFGERYIKDIKASDIDSYLKKISR